MKDYFKELNIIDILGIGVPGCLLLLLLGGDQTAELLWMDQFNNHPLAFGIVLIAVGSLAGMLLQELGDMIEKGLWLIPCLDPKVYAAYIVNTDDLKAEQMKDLEDHATAIPEGDAAKAMSIVSLLATGAVILCAAVLFPCAMVHAALPRQTAARSSLLPILGLSPLAVTAGAVLLLRTKLPDQKSDAWTKINTLRCANPYIQTRLVNHGNTSKRTLFDGWRFVMRNLILVLAMTNLISLWKPLDLYRRVAGEMIGPGGNMSLDLFFLTLLVSCAVSLMLVRYYHYAYLRYKYSLENFMRLDKEDDPPAKS